jgi:hypothetical protein
MCQHPPASAPLDPESEEAWTTMKAMHDPGEALIENDRDDYNREAVADGM